MMKDVQFFTRELKDLGVMPVLPASEIRLPPSPPGITEEELKLAEQARARTMQFMLGFGVLGKLQFVQKVWSSGIKIGKLSDTSDSLPPKGAIKWLRGYRLVHTDTKSTHPVFKQGGWVKNRDIILNKGSVNREVSIPGTVSYEASRTVSGGDISTYDGLELEVVDYGRREWTEPPTANRALVLRIFSGAIRPLESFPGSRTIEESYQLEDPYRHGNLEYWHKWRTNGIEPKIMTPHLQGLVLHQKYTSLDQEPQLVQHLAEYCLKIRQGDYVNPASR